MSIKILPSYNKIPLAIWLLATITLISRSGSMVLVFLTIYLVRQLHFDIVLAGQILSFYGLGEISGSYIGGILADRFGFLNIQTLGFFFIGIFYILLEFTKSKTEISIVIFTIGVFTAGIRPAMGANISKFSYSDNRAQSYALNYQALNIGAAVGPALGGIISSLNYAWLFRIDGAANIIAAITLLFFFYKKRQILHKRDKSFKISSPLENKHFIFFLILVFLVGSTFFLYFNAYPLFLNEYYHLSKEKVGIILGTNGFLIAILQMQITSFLKRFNLLYMIGIGGSIITFGYLILPLYSGLGYAFLTIIFITLGEMIAVPFIFDYVARIAPEKEQGKYFGLTSCALMSLPLVITSNAGLYIYQKMGSTPLWIVVGCIGIIILFFANNLHKKQNIISD